MSRTFVLDVDKLFGLGVEISEKTKLHEWEKLPWHWVVERTLSWPNGSLRLSKGYEITRETFLKLIMPMILFFRHSLKESSLYFRIVQVFLISGRFT